MSIPVHIAVGIVIGKMTGNYAASLIAATAVDLDHGLSYLRQEILFHPKELIKAIITEKDPWSDQRNVFHNIIVWAVVSAFSFLGGINTGLAVSLGYFSHLILDALDNADYYPFYPNTIIDLKGPVRYFSAHEAFVIAMLGGIYILL